MGESCPETFSETKYSENITTNGEETHNSEQSKDFVCNLSREGILENRRIKRKVKRDAARLEKQKQREQKLIKDRISQNRSDKLKMVKEEEIRKFRRNQIKDQSDDHIDIIDEIKLENESFELSYENFPNLSHNACDILEENLSIETYASSSKTNNRFSSKLQNIPDFKTKDFRIYEKDFPVIGRAEKKSDESTKISADSDGRNVVGNHIVNSIEFCDISLNSDIKDQSSLKTTNCISCRQNDLSDNIINKNGSEESERQQVKTKPSGIISKGTHVQSRRNPVNSRISNRPYYCINLLQTAKVRILLFILN